MNREQTVAALSAHVGRVFRYTRRAVRNGLQAYACRSSFLYVVGVDSRADRQPQLVAWKVAPQGAAGCFLLPDRRRGRTALQPETLLRRAVRGQIPAVFFLPDGTVRPATLEELAGAEIEAQP